MRTGFDFADVYDEAVSRAGGEQSTAEDVIRVRRGMRLLMERWEAKGFNTWRIRHVDVNVSGSEDYVQLPDCIDDILQVNRETGGTLTRMTSAEYIQISRKAIGGTPSSYWLSREEAPKLYLHPKGISSGLVVWYVERPADFDRRADGMDDVPGRWLEALITGLAWDFARKRPNAEGVYNEGLIQRLKIEAAEAEDIATRADRERVKFKYRIG